MTPTLNLFSSGAGLGFPFPSFSVLYNQQLWLCPPVPLSSHPTPIWPGVVLIFPLLAVFSLHLTSHLVCFVCLFLVWILMESGSHVTQAGLKLNIQLWVICLHLPRARITNVYPPSLVLFGSGAQTQGFLNVSQTLYQLSSVTS